jgi:hypothetical protein
VSQTDRDRVWEKFEQGEIDLEELDRRLAEVEDVEERVAFFMAVRAAG